MPEHFCCAICRWLHSATHKRPMVVEMVSSYAGLCHRKTLDQQHRQTRLTSMCFCLQVLLHCESWFFMHACRHFLCQHMHVERCTAPSHPQSPLLLQDPMAWAQRAISNNEFRCANC